MTKSAGSLDTNILLRVITGDVPDQLAAAIKLLDETPGQFDVADTAFIEVAFGLERHYDLDRKRIAEAINELMNYPQINCNRALLSKALPIFVKHSNLSFEDCCLAVYAELNDAIPLWTFDQKLAKQAPSAKLVPSS